MKNLAIALSFFLFTSALSAQSDLERAKQQLGELKNSFLLVRLQTAEKQISYLEKNGRKDEAEEVRQEQYRENKEIILSFDQTFHFCPVYFFYADASEDIRRGNLEGHVFQSDQQLVDPIKLQERPFFTAEFSETDGLGIKALVLMDQDMIPLESPFPFYQRKYIFFSLIAQSKATMIDKYNDKLFSHYESWIGSDSNNEE